MMMLLTDGKNNSRNSTKKKTLTAIKKNTQRINKIWIQLKKNQKLLKMNLTEQLEI